MKATFVNVGYGDCILLQNENGYTALIDGGSDLESEFAGDPYRIRASDYLKEQHISHLDAVFISHIHEDHVCGLEKVLNSVTADVIYTPLSAGCFHRSTSSHTAARCSAKCSPLHGGSQCFWSASCGTPKHKARR